MKTNETKINDGVYFLHPEGSCWIGAIYREGKLVDTVEEANVSTHLAANDRCSGMAPSESDIDVPVATAAQVVREVMGDDVDPQMVVVTQSVS